MDRICEYAILRYVPAAYRGEQVNVGLVIMDGQRVDVRLYAPPSLLKALGADQAALDWIPSYIREQADPTLPAEHRWKRISRFPGFVLSDRGWLSAESNEQYEQRIDRIRSDYIDRPSRRPVKKRSTSIVRELRGVFRDYNVMGKKLDEVADHKVVSNLPVGPSGKLHVDFVVKNGIYHATETADFRRTQDVGTAELKEAALVAVTLQYAREHLGSGSTRCYFVYAANAMTESAINPALQVAERNVDGIFNIESGEQRRSYFDIMLTAAGSPSLFKSN